MLNDDAYDDIHDGLRVQTMMELKQVSGAALASVLKINRSRVYRLYEEKNWPTGFLVAAGEKLGFNFFDQYASIVELGSPRRISIPIQALTDESLLASIRAEVERAGKKSDLK